MPELPAIVAFLIPLGAAIAYGFARGLGRYLAYRAARKVFK